LIKDDQYGWAVKVATEEKRWEMLPLERASFQSNGAKKIEALTG